MSIPARSWSRMASWVASSKVSLTSVWPYSPALILSRAVQNQPGKPWLPMTWVGIRGRPGGAIDRVLQLGPEAGGFEGQLGEWRKRARRDAFQAPGRLVMISDGAIGIDHARIRIDDPVVRHAMLRVELKLRPSVDVGRGRRQHLDRQRGGTLDPAVAHRAEPIEIHIDDVGLDHGGRTQDAVDRGDIDLAESVCLDVPIEDPEQVHDDFLVSRARRRRYREIAFVDLAPSPVTGEGGVVL